jgi:hypothetical protein
MIWDVLLQSNLGLSARESNVLIELETSWDQCLAGIPS